MTSPDLLLRTLIDYRYAFSWARAANFLKIVSGYILSSLRNRAVVWGVPCVLMVEPTNRCNLRCPLCPSGTGALTRPQGRMAFEEFRTLIDEVGEHLILLMLWNQGEPFLHPDLPRMIRYAKDRAIPTVTSTNGHFIRSPEDARELVESELDELVVSLDGASSETYRAYRVGGDFETVLEGIRLLRTEKRRSGSRRPFVHLQFIVMRHNEHEIPEAERLARSLGVDKFSLKTAQVYSPEEADRFLPSEERYRRYRLSDGSFEVKSSRDVGCRHLWYTTVVNWDGTVCPCCFDKDGHYVLGNAFDGAGLKEIWLSPKYQRFRNLILWNRRTVPICSNCSEGLGNLYSRIEAVRVPGFEETGDRRQETGD